MIGFSKPKFQNFDDARTGRLPGIALLVSLAVLALAPAPGAFAQSRDTQQLIDRMDRLERELGTVQRQAFGGKPPAPGAAPSGPPPTEGSLAAMQVRLDIPEDVARQLAPDSGRLTRAALEAVALEGVRSGKLTVSLARRLLGISSRYEMDGFLKTRGVLLDLSIDDIRRDSDSAGAFSK